MLLSIEKETKSQAMMDKTQHNKLKIEKHELYFPKQKTKDWEARTLLPQTNN